MLEIELLNDNVETLEEHMVEEVMEPQVVETDDGSVGEEIILQQQEVSSFSPQTRKTPADKDCSICCADKKMNKHDATPVPV